MNPELAPFLSTNELLALNNSSLPFDAIALYIRVFCFNDKGNGQLVHVSFKTMAQLNGTLENNVIQPLRRARLRTQIKHLERVGLINKPVINHTKNKPKFSRTYSRLLTNGLTSITIFEYSKLVDLSLSYEALCLYVRAIRPNLNVNTFEAIVCYESVNEALTHDPLSGSTEKFKIGQRLFESALTELVNVGLITYKKGCFNYIFTCHVSDGFNSSWLKTLAMNHE